MTNQARLCNDNACLNNIAAYLYTSCLFALSVIQLNHFKIILYRYYALKQINAKNER